MSTEYYCGKGLEELKSKLTSIIDVPNEDNFRTHFRRTILFKDENKVSGTVRQDSFKIWTHEQGRGGLTGSRLFSSSLRFELLHLSSGKVKTKAGGYSPLLMDSLFPQRHQ